MADAAVILDVSPAAADAENCVADRDTTHGLLSISQPTSADELDQTTATLSVALDGGSLSVIWTGSTDTWATGWDSLSSFAEDVIGGAIGTRWNIEAGWSGTAFPGGTLLTFTFEADYATSGNPYSYEWEALVCSPAAVQEQDPLGVDPCVETTTEAYFEVLADGDEPTAVVVTASIDGGTPETVLTWTDESTYSWGAGYDGSSFVYDAGEDGLLQVTVVRTGGWPPGATVTMAAAGEVVGGGSWDDSWQFALCGERDTATCTTGQARLIEVLKRPRVQRYLCILLNQVDDLIGAVGGVLAGRSISAAIGIQLDRIGQLYEFLRQGADDATYRARLQALAVVTGSAGRPDELLDVLLTLDDGDDASSIAYVPHYPAAFILTYTVAAGAWLEGMLWGEILRRADPSGVQSVLLFYERDVDIFGWSGEGGVGWDAGIWAEGF